MCSICKNYMVFSSTFFCTVTGKKFYIRGNFSCNSTDVIYLVECINCKCQYVGSAFSFKQCFCIHKSDIKTKKDCCGTAGIQLILIVTWKGRSWNKCSVMPVRTQKVFYGSVKNTDNVNYLQTCMVWIAFLIYIVEVEKVAEKSNLFMTTLYFN